MTSNERETVITDMLRRTQMLVKLGWLGNVNEIEHLKMLDAASDETLLDGSHTLGQLQIACEMAEVEEFYATHN